jgi:hypothetical protein
MSKGKYLECWISDNLRRKNSIRGNLFRAGRSFLLVSVPIWGILISLEIAIGK